MASLAFDPFPADDFDRRTVNEPWFIEAKDKDARSEFTRQSRFIVQLAKQAPAVDVLAIPNANTGSDWEKVRRWKEGARRGALDLVISWEPTRLNDRGVFYAEFKDGQKMPTPHQRARLNMYFRQGHGCGVYRRPETLIEHLRNRGAPFL